MTRERDTLRFDGTLSGIRVSGNVRLGGARGSFELMRLARVDTATYARISGAYRLSADEYVVIGRFDDRDDPWPGLPQVVHYPSGRWGVLLPTSDSTFFSGRSIGVDFPADLVVSTIREAGSDVIGLEWREGGNAARRAVRVPFRDEEVTFANGDVVLSGTLRIPATPGPHPAIVLMHGAGPYGRRHGALDYLFYPFGVATLHFDKRGVGRSTGNWQSATHHELARDAIAAVNLLRRRRDIAGDRVGLFASSNSAWAAPIAATEERNIAFIISRTTPAHSELENVIYERESAVRDRGFGGEVAARVRALHERQLAVIRSDGEGWEEFRQAVEAAAREPWFELAGIPGRLRSLSDGNAVRQWIRGARWRLFDPTEYWARVTSPVLIIQAEWDKQVPTAMATPLLRAAVQRSGNPASRVLVMPKAQHGMIEVATGSFPELAEVVRARGYPREFLPTMIGWLRERVAP
jgi:pimeloyl-ACP methyl ester carboxylesterase